MNRLYRFGASLVLAMQLFPVLGSPQPVMAAGEMKPFPQHTVYTAGTIKPNHVTQAQMDTAVEQYYDEWVSRYIVASPNKPNEEYVWYNKEGEGASDASIVSTSEGHGYGMLVTALMAGYSSSAKAHFDALYNFYKSHPSANNPYTMGWQQRKDSSGNIVAASGGNDSATDGDMDIAYALLLADKQWGSSGAINYLAAATNAINGIMQADVNSSVWNLKLGDWAANNDATYGKGTRPSDFMLNHLKAFQTATGDTNWQQVINKTYAIINQLYANNSPNTGLLPDFANSSTGASYAPVGANYLEGANDGSYSYNSCRTPWRIATDYLMSGDTSALAELTKLNTWIQTKTSSNPGSIKDGYSLSGNALSGTSSGVQAFIAPFAVSAMIDSGNQAWLNSLWTNMTSTSTASTGYYENSIRLLSMIVVSGNWWSPSSSTTPPPATGNIALGKTYSASSIWNSSYTADKAFDGDASTRWSASSGSLNNQWVSVDLGAATAFNQVVIKEASFQRVSSYKLQSSTDGTTYTDIAGTSGTTIGASKTVGFSPVTSRFVRLYITSASDVPTINELEVYNSTSGPDTTAPTAPAGLTATAASSSQIQLSWTASTDNVGITGYDVYRGGTLIGTAATAAYTDTGLAASTAYSYTVKAKDAAGNVSAASNTATATTPAAGGNLALGKAYSASTTWSTSYPAANAFDGSTSTRWSASSGSLNNQWVTVDFGTAVTYSQIVIKEITYQRVSSYKLQSSADGTTFTDIAGTAGTTIGASKTVNFTPVTARYLRVYIITATDVPTLNEVEAYSL